MNFQNRKYQLLTDKFSKMGQKIVNHQSGFLGFDVGEGRLPQVGVEEQFPQGDEQSIAEAISYVQKVAEQYPDDFARWAATSDVLNKVDGDSVRKARSIDPARQANQLVILTMLFRAYPVRGKAC
jgi:hypothetical protein